MIIIGDCCLCKWRTNILLVHGDGWPCLFAYPANCAIGARVLMMATAPPLVLLLDKDYRTWILISNHQRLYTTIYVRMYEYLYIGVYVGRHGKCGGCLAAVLGLPVIGWFMKVNIGNYMLEYYICILGIQYWLRIRERKMKRCRITTFCSSTRGFFLFD